MTVSFVDTDYNDFTYEINDGELVNDVICIVGEPDLEVITRGYDAASIAKYGRRTLRIDNPIVANVLADYATPRAQVTAILDRGIEPYALVNITVTPVTSARIAEILAMDISDLVQITETTCGLVARYFIVESIDIGIEPDKMLVVNIGLVQARTAEIPLA